MIYAHSSSEIEILLAKQLSKVETLVEASLFRRQGVQANFIGHETLLYSCLDWKLTRNMINFEAEKKFAQELASKAKEAGMRRIIVLSYPGSYINSDNLILAHRAQIEKIFQSNGIQTIVFKIQSVYDSQFSQTSLCALFFNELSNKIELPQSNNSIVYAISTTNLLQSILKAETYERSATFDLFDDVHSLSYFFYMHHPLKVQQFVSPLVLKFKSFFGLGPSLASIDLFSRPLVPMHNLRVSKELGLVLDPDLPAYNQHSTLNIYKLNPASSLAAS